ncbi:MAG: hypothetical protein EX269_08750 [Acidimicrobiales bacterium]|nr:MAG: hypothetical protein EX269_08750 [Acidimicrobiales bacterium]
MPSPRPLPLFAAPFVLVVMVASLLMTGTASAAALCNGETPTIVGRSSGTGTTLIVGTDGPDVIMGTPGADIIRALGGNDVVCGGGGRDVIVGGFGKDLLMGDGGPDKVIGGAGADRVMGGGGRDLLKGGSGADVVIGGKGEDRCFDNRAEHYCERVNSEAGTTPTAPASLTDVVPSHSLNASLSEDQFTAIIADEIFRLVNVERARAGVDPLVRDAALDAGSKRWSTAMAAPGALFMHDPNLGFAGENIAQNYILEDYTRSLAAAHAGSLMGQWMNSSGHRANILKADYENFGAGVAMKGNLTYATQRFTF